MASVMVFRGGKFGVEQKKRTGSRQFSIKELGG